MTTTTKNEIVKLSKQISAFSSLLNTEYELADAARYVPVLQTALDDAISQIVRVSRNGNGEKSPGRGGK